MNSQQKLNKKIFEKDVELRATRDGFGEGLVMAGELNDQIVALTADLAESTRIEGFKKQFSERFIEVGVAEQNLVTVASGMAAAGKIPFVSSYATFSPGRNWEQIRTTICYNNQPVKIVGAHAGISVGPDGATHQALEDIAMMRVLPNMIVVVPMDAIEAKKATLAIAVNGKPSYIRLSRDKTPVITTEESPFRLGQAEVLRDGKDVTIVGCGTMMFHCLQAAEELAKDKISTRVINCHTIKPIDEKTILQAAEETGAIVTVEEHQKAGGLGGAVVELLSEHYPVPVRRVGVADHFGESGEPGELLEKFGLDKSGIIKAVLGALRLKK